MYDVGTHKNRLVEGILMSTHNIYFQAKSEKNYLSVFQKMHTLPKALMAFDYSS